MNLITWNISPHIIAGTTTRSGGVSSFPFDTLNFSFYVGDMNSDVLENRHRLANHIKQPLERWIFPKITHSDHFVKVSTQDQGKGAFVEKGSLWGVDALYTDCENLPLAIFHADCVPILCYCPSRKLIGAIHAGWLGTTKAITYKMLSHWILNENCPANDIYVYIGPAISQENMNIRDDVIKKIKAMDFDTQPYLEYTSPTTAKLDSVGLNVQQCLLCNIPIENIRVLNECTYELTDKYYSYRRSPKTGRNISFIVRNPD